MHSYDNRTISVIFIIYSSAHCQNMACAMFTNTKYIGLWIIVLSAVSTKFSIIVAISFFDHRPVASH